MTETRKVRTTIEPHKVIEVSEQEFTDLSRQGLIAGEPDGTEPTGTGDPSEIKRERKR